MIYSMFTWFIFSDIQDSHYSHQYCLIFTLFTLFTFIIIKIHMFKMIFRIIRIFDIHIRMIQVFHIILLPIFTFTWMNGSLQNSHYLLHTNNPHYLKYMNDVNAKSLNNIFIHFHIRMIQIIHIILLLMWTLTWMNEFLQNSHYSHTNNPHYL